MKKGYRRHAKYHVRLLGTGFYIIRLGYKRPDGSMCIFADKDEWEVKTYKEDNVTMYVVWPEDRLIPADAKWDYGSESPWPIFSYLGEYDHLGVGVGARVNPHNELRREGYSRVPEWYLKKQKDCQPEKVWLYVITPGFKRKKDEDTLDYLDRMEPFVKKYTLAVKVTDAHAQHLIKRHGLKPFYPEGIYTEPKNLLDIGGEPLEDCERTTYQIQPKMFLENRGWW